MGLGDLVGAKGRLEIPLRLLRNFVLKVWKEIWGALKEGHQPTIRWFRTRYK